MKSTLGTAGNLDRAYPATPNADAPIADNAAPARASSAADSRTTGPFADLKPRGSAGAGTPIPLKGDGGKRPTPIPLHLRQSAPELRMTPREYVVNRTAHWLGKHIKKKYADRPGESPSRQEIRRMAKDYLTFKEAGTITEVNKLAREACERYDTLQRDDEALKADPPPRHRSDDERAYADLSDTELLKRFKAQIDGPGRERWLDVVQKTVYADRSSTVGGRGKGQKVRFDETVMAIEPPTYDDDGAEAGRVEARPAAPPRTSMAYRINRGAEVLRTMVESGALGRPGEPPSEAELEQAAENYIAKYVSIFTAQEHLTKLARQVCNAYRKRASADE